MEENNNKIAIELYEQYDYSKIDNKNFTKDRLSSVLDRMINMVNIDFRSKTDEMVKNEETLWSKKSLFEDTNKDVLSKISFLKSKIGRINDSIDTLEKQKKTEEKKLEEERLKTKDSYVMPFYWFIIFAFAAGIGELLSYFHMFQAQEYMINELTGVSYTGQTTTQGMLYYLFPLLLGLSLVASIIFLSKYVGKILRQQKNVHQECSEEQKAEQKVRIELNKKRQSLYEKLNENEISEVDLLKIQELDKLIQKSRVNMFFIKIREFFCSIMTREFILFGVIGSLFVLGIAYGATELRESALKQQYDAAKLSLQMKQNINDLVNQESNEEVSLQSLIGDMLNEGDSTQTASTQKSVNETEKASGEGEVSLQEMIGGMLGGEEGTGSTSNNAASSTEQLIAEKFQHIKNIYDSRANGSIWFFFINAIMYIVGILLGYFSHSSNREYEACEVAIKKISSDIKKNENKLDKLNRQLADYNKSHDSLFNKIKHMIGIGYTNTKEQYLDILKDLDNNAQDIKEIAHDEYAKLLSNYYMFIEFQLRNMESLNFTPEEAEVIFNTKVNQMRNNHREGIFKYLDKETDYLHSDTWNELLSRSQK